MRGERREEIVGGVESGGEGGFLKGGVGIIKRVGWRVVGGVVLRGGRLNTLSSWLGDWMGTGGRRGDG